MADGPEAADRVGAPGQEPGIWGMARPVVLVALVGVTGLAVWAVGSWIQDGRAGYGIPAALLAVACVCWVLTFGRPRRIAPSTSDPESTVLRPSPRHAARIAVMTGLAPLVFALGAFDRSRPDPTVGGAVISATFMLLVVFGILGAHGMLRSELRITTDEVVFELPRGPFPGVSVSRRSRRQIDGYRRRFGSVELLPWPLPGGPRGAEARRHRLVIPWTVLPTADVVAALQRSGIRPA